MGRGLRVVAGKERTIIIDNVGLYNHFGLPDANRKWQMHFRGRDDVEPQHYAALADMAAEAGFDESRLEEDNEQMVVVRGKARPQAPAAAPAPAKPKAEEFTLCDYFLVRGNQQKFKIWTLDKKRGKPTGGVGPMVCDYDGARNPIVLGPDAGKNRSTIETLPRLRAVVAFAALLANADLPTVCDLAALARLSHSAPMASATPLDLLRAIARLAGGRKA